jgi:hypothetical protein
MSSSAFSLAKNTFSFLPMHKKIAVYVIIIDLELQISLMLQIPRN